MEQANQYNESTGSNVNRMAYIAGIIVGVLIFITMLLPSPNKKEKE